MPRRPLIPPPTVMNKDGRPRTKWDLLAEKEPPRAINCASGATPCRGLAEEAPMPGLPKFTKRFT